MHACLKGCLAQGGAPGLRTCPVPTLLWGLGQAQLHPPDLPFFITLELRFIALLLVLVLSSYLWNHLFNLPYLTGSPRRETLGGLHRACALNLMNELMKYFVDSSPNPHFVDGS